jgi:hypothetical protein
MSRKASNAPPIRSTSGPIADHNAAMKTIKNKTNKPLRVPLPRGKTLHLGPAKSGQVTTEAAEHPGLKKLVDAGEIELSDDGPGSSGGAGGPGGGGARHGHGSGGGVMRRSGDR